MRNSSELKASQTCLVVENVDGKQEGLDHNHKSSFLLDFSASNDIIGFKDAIEKKGHDVYEVGLWYGRKIGSKKMGYEKRTPLMIAAMFGSKDVLSYILGTGKVDVNQASGSDGATALHCAIFGSSSASIEVIKLLLNSSANVNVVDANGNRPIDLIDLEHDSFSNSRKRVLKAILDGEDCAYDACLVLDKAISPMGRIQQPLRDMDHHHIDHSLPDINNEMYSTNEFRMYAFKVKPCSRAYCHNWTECPFVHPGENARRRDPRMYQYSCVPCPEFRKGSCSKGDSCEYAHGIFESWLHPAQYRTRLCKDESKCNRRVCFFAHSSAELRPVFASTGSALPSPTLSYSPSLTLSGGSSPTSWHIQTSFSVPTLEVLKNATSYSDIDLDIMQQLMIDDDMSGISSSPSKWKSLMLNSPSFHDHVGELSRFSRVKLTNLDDLYSCNNVIGSPSHRVNSAAATTILNSRNDAASFSQRSQSFNECGVMLSCNVDQYQSTLFGWGSPDSTLDWSIHKEELNKMRKSASFGLGSNTSTSPSTMATTSILHQDDVIDEYDVSWVDSLVKDDRDQNQKLQCHLNNEQDVIPAWDY